MNENPKRMIKLKVSIERTFALRAYENIKPHYEIEEEFEFTTDKDIGERQNQLRKVILDQLSIDEKRARATKPQSTK